MPILTARIKTEKEDDLFVLTDYTDQKELRLQILNINNSEAYVGGVSDVQLRSMAAELRMPFKSYMQETISAFSVRNDDHQYLFALINCGLECTIKWTKSADEGIKIHLGEMTLEHVVFTRALCDILSIMSTEMSKSNIKNGELEEKLEESKKELDKTHLLLSETLEMKEHLEDELYSKFAMVLNGKKRKMRELYETIDKLKSARGGKNKPQINRKHGTNHANASPSECIDDPGPSNNIKKIEDTSLILSDEDDPPPPKLCKPRIRQKGHVALEQSVCSSRKNTRTRVRDIDVDSLLDDI